MSSIKLSSCDFSMVQRNPHRWRFESTDLISVQVVILVGLGRGPGTSPLRGLTKGTFVPGTSSFFEELNGNEFHFKGTRN